MPRSKNALAPDVIPLVCNGIKYLHSEVGHSYFIAVRKAERIAQRNLFFILYDRIQFTADVTAGLLNKGQDFFNFFTNHQILRSLTTVKRLLS